MDKTISITIAGLIYHVEEMAYRQLESWLAAVKHHFARYDDSEEIVRDIENRIAEIFAGQITGSKQVVTSADVEEVIRQIGTVEDFEIFEGKSGEPDKEYAGEPASVREKRLFRDPDNSVFGGVAAGVAAYFGMDVTATRLAFTLLAIFWGISILIYLVLWMVMPAAMTPAQKLQMRGEPVTLAGLEEKIKAKVPPKEEITSAVGRFLHRLTRFLGDLGERVVSFIRKAGSPLLSLVGIVLIIAGAFSALFLTVAFIATLTTPTEAWIGASLSQFASSPSIHYLLMTSLWLVMTIPALLILVAGLAMTRQKRKFRTAPAAIVLLGIWVIALLVAVIFGIREMPAYEANYENYVGNLDQYEKSFQVANFRSISISGGHQVFIVPSDTHFVRARGYDQALEDQLRVQVTGGELTVSNDRICFLCFFRQARLEIGLSAPEKLSLQGATQATLNGFHLDNLTVNLSGVSFMESDSEIRHLSTRISGASKTTFSGDITHAEIRVSGASHVAITEPLRSLKITASGASMTEMGEILESLEASLSGGSLLSYAGEPVHSDIEASSGSHATLHQ